MIVAYLSEKRKRLEAQDKRLSPYFVEVYIESLNASVPFLSIRAFRECDVFDGKQIEKTFLSSGSTQTKRARHHFSFDGLTRYARGAVDGWFHYANQAGFSSSTTILSLVPKPDEWPQSSLAAMIDMFARQGLQVCYVNEKTIANEAAALFAQGSTQVVVFGTSFHFVGLQAVLSKNPIAADGKEIFIIDTGGTKGRTESYSQSELSTLIKSYFSADATIRLHSEYGMCELASQAYGTTPGLFTCNTCLQVHAIAPNFQKTAAAGEQGFLAFIDENNDDSYPAILTEDLGVVFNPQTFHLVGRAPDAAIKGCSLRVNPNFSFAARPFENPLSTAVTLSGGHQNPSAKNILEALKKTHWDEFAKRDLQKSLQDWDTPTSYTNQRYENKTIGIVASANIPITWLYPTRYLSDAGAKAVHIFLPSLRPDDVLSTRVRAQIESLACSVAPQLNCDVVIEHEKISEDGLRAFDTLLVFGQNETIELYQSRFAHVIGFGDVCNCYEVQPTDTIASLAEQCATWFGRGCLTPTVLAFSDPIQWDANNFAATLSHHFLERARATGLTTLDQWVNTAHAFDTIDLRAVLFSLGLKTDNRICYLSPVSIVDLRSLSVDVCTQIDLQYGGSGCVYLLDTAQLRATQTLKGAATFLPSPTLFTPHCGLIWPEWLAK